MKSIITLFTLFFSLSFYGQTFEEKNGEIILYSKTKTTSIKAESNNYIARLNTGTGGFSAVVPVNSFKFKKSLMQKHFNQKGFMYSEKYPEIKFKGKISSFDKSLKPGTYKYSIVGNITIKGVTEPQIAHARLVIIGKKLTLYSKFTVKDIGRFEVGKSKDKKEKSSIPDNIEIESWITFN